MNIGITVPAYNEAENIAFVLSSLREQELGEDEIREIVVVASACTDGTDEVVRRFASADSRVKLLTEPERRGKAAAINSYTRTRSPQLDVVVVCSADLILEPRTIARLIAPIRAGRAEMTGGRPMPNNREGTAIGQAVRLLWQLHHRLALRAPKLGEVVAIRADYMPLLDESILVDEAFLESAVSLMGGRLEYVPDAVAENHGPESLSDLFKQRRRIACGHHWLASRTGYRVSSLNYRQMVPAVLSEVIDTSVSWRSVKGLVTLFAVEAAARLSGWVDWRRGEKHAILESLRTTKRLRDGSAAALPPPAQAEPAAPTHSSIEPAEVAGTRTP